MVDEFDTMMGEAASAASTVSTSDLRSLVMLGEKTVTMKGYIDEMEEQISKLKQEYNELRQKDLPEAMAKVGLAKFTLDSGVEIKIDEFVGGGLPKDSEGKEKAINWLVENGAGGLIKTGVSMTFGRDQYEEALALTADLKAKGLPVEMGTGVHPQTLHAFVRERMRAGEPVDQATLGVFVGRVAKFKGA